MRKKLFTFLLTCLLLFSVSGFVSASPAGVVIHGKVLDSKTHQPVPGTVTIFLDSDYLVQRTDFEYGEFSEALTDYGWYLIKISAKGYIEKTDTLWVMNDERPDLRRDYYLTPQSFLGIFSNPIYFDYNQATLSPEAVSELDAVISFLNENPGMSCQVNGHADKSGYPDANLALSEDRAYSVYDYLVDKGIDRARLRTFGYGSAIPAHSEGSKSTMMKDRRVELIPFETDSEGLVPQFDNIYFDFNKAVLSQAYEKELENIVDFLKKNPQAVCEIAGHADTLGTKSGNAWIAQQRAETVVQYLTGQGIDNTRLKARGYSYTRPLDTNSTTEGRARNRRVEFNIRII
jgi:outer membrane protein OmpA-like peptidoglycan-associated protein